MDRRTALKLGLAALGGAVCPAVSARPIKTLHRAATTITYRGTKIRDVTIDEVCHETVYGKACADPLGVRTTLRVIGHVAHDQIPALNHPGHHLTVRVGDNTWFDVPPGVVGLATCTSLATALDKGKCRIVLGFNQATPRCNGRVQLWWHDDIDPATWMITRLWTGKWTIGSTLTWPLELPSGWSPPLEQGFNRKHRAFHVPADGRWVDFQIVDHEAWAV